jgi:gamma-glutamylputrescine oxidase
MTVSHWRRTLRLGTLACDVLVVGAGVCGVSAGLHLARRGLRVIVVERHTLGSGASTRNAGFLMRGCADNYLLATQQYGRERARLLWKLTEDNLAGLRQEGIEQLPGVRRVPSVLLAMHDAEREELIKSVALMREDGFETSWVEHGSDSAWASGACQGGLVNPHDASCNSREVMEHLANTLTKTLSVPILEQQEVCEIAEVGTRVRTRTNDAEITSAHVLVCTNAYAPLLLPELELLITPRRGQMFAMQPQGLRLDASYYANRGSEYFRQAADGTIVVGGCRTYHADKELGYDDRTTPWVQEDLERFASLVFGMSVGEIRASIIARWAGTMGFTPHHLPVICPTTAGGARVWFCGGFTGHGMSMAHRTSQIACEVMLDDAPNMFAMGSPDLCD